MKVYIGKYPNRINFYLIFEYLNKITWLAKIGLTPDRLDAICEHLEERTWIGRKLDELSNKRQRKVKVIIHDYDTWSMDNTLAHIILPLLLKMKGEKQGSPLVDIEDVPKQLRPTEAEMDLYRTQGITDDNFFKRWDFVIDEMIFAFENEDTLEYDVCKLNPFIDDAECLSKDINNIDYHEVHQYSKRVTNGFRLFGKYYQSLWT